MIAANLPDIDALGVFFGENLAWRRGWTHGPIALVLLPLLLAPAMVLFDRWQASRNRRPTGRLPVRFGWVLALAYIGILSHPLLDFLNTYGIRLLMPFSNRWFYGDALFIIDLWMRGALGIGVWLSVRRKRQRRANAGRPALIALLLVAGYAAAMGAAGRVAEHTIARELAARGDQPVRVLASPVPVNPFRRRILFEVRGGYGFGDFRWGPSPRFTIEPGFVPTNMDNPMIEAARRDKPVADFLYWSRYPFAVIRPVPGGTEVIISDARYSGLPGDGRFTVRTLILGTEQAPGQPPKPPAPASPPE
jgi:inner membrane protein